MSIVENVIRKLHKVGKPEQGIARPEALGYQSESTYLGLESRVDERTIVKPGSSLVIDLARLRDINAVPPLDLEYRTEDEFRRIKWPILRPLIAEENVPNRRELLVTSSIPEEGKTFITLNLALSIAREKDYAVLLVDADVAKPSLSRTFNAEAHRGLTDLLLDESLPVLELIAETNIDGLWFLPAGHSHPMAPELLASNRMKRIADEMAAMDSRRIILFDSPPLLAANEAQALSQHISNVLMVIRAEFTSPSLVADSLAQLGSSRQVNYVLNRAPRNASRSYYGSYYGSERQKTFESKYKNAT